MIAVSDAWKTIHKDTLLPETFIEIAYEVSEPGLQEDASATATLEESFSQAETLVSTLAKTPEKYATLEWNSFGLDGSFEYFDGTPTDPGYTSSLLSGSSAAYTSLPTITIRFSQVHTSLIPGITITWSETLNEWASRFRVTAYNGSSWVAQVTASNNTMPISQVPVDIENFDSIVIEILEWSLPYRRARVNDVFVGLRRIYSKNDLVSYSHTQSVDLLSAALPSNKVTFSLRNDEAQWNPDNPMGMERYLLERQLVKVRYGMTVDGNTEWIDGGQFWLSEWSTPANGMEASFTAKDALDFMHEIYTGRRSGTLYEIATAAFVQADLPVMPDGSARYVVDTSLKNYSTDFSGQDDEYTVAEVLQMTAHMACCVMYQDRSGRVQLRPHQSVLTDYLIDRNVSYAHPEYEISKPLKAVVVSYGDAKATISVGTSGEVQTVDNPFVTTLSNAQRGGEAAKARLKGRKTISGEFRADPRLDVLDVITVESKYADNTVTITDVTYSTSGGAMRGTYTGRVKT